MTVQELDALDPVHFVETTGWVFEHSPWVAERAAAHRPFDSLDALANAMNRVVAEAEREEQLALLRAHPDLGTRARVSASSAAEQAGVGLDRLTQAEYDRLLALNTAYKDRFGFPFLYAVKGATKAAILEALGRRLESSREAEFAEALRQVWRIARFRLEEIVR